MKPQIINPEGKKRSPVSIKEIELVIRNLPTKQTSITYGSLVNSKKIFKGEIISYLNLEKRGGISSQLNL